MGEDISIKEVPTVFYSWQSDNSKTRYFVEKALRTAINRITANPNIELALRMDKDTQGVPGAVGIADTILQKIDGADIVLADVSLVEKSSTGELLSNQNVLFELGYAVGRKTYSFVILVANIDLGKIEDLPFDIKHRRVIGFSPTEKNGMERLAESLAFAITAELEARSKPETEPVEEPLKDKLMGLISNEKPTRSTAEKYFTQLYEKYLSASPGRFKGSDVDTYKANIFNSYESTRQLTEEFFEVIQHAAENNDEITIVAAYKESKIITRFYNVVPEDNGSMYEASVEFYALLEYELVSIIVGCLARDGRWETIAKLRNTKLPRESGHSTQFTFDDIYHYPELIGNYYKSLKDLNFVYPMSPLIDERFASRQDILLAYISGSLAIYLLVDHFFMWNIGELLGANWEERVPEYIAEFKSKKFVEKLMLVANTQTIEDFRNQIEHIVLRDLNAMMAYHHNNLFHIFQYNGINNLDEIASQS